MESETDLVIVIFKLSETYLQKETTEIALDDNKVTIDFSAQIYK